MSKRFNSKLYLNAKYTTVKDERGRWHSAWWSDPDGYLLAEGTYRTKIKPQDLPDWYVGGYLYKRHGFISTKGVVDILYEPDYFIENHWHKYDNFYVSFSRKMTRTVDDRGFTHCEDYDYIMDAAIAYKFIEKLKIYSPDIDTSEIERELKMKTAWFNMRRDEGPLVITPDTPIRIFSVSMHHPWIVSLGFNDSEYKVLNMQTLAEKLPNVAEHKDYFKELHFAKIEPYGYGISFDCGLHLTAEECYQYREDYPKEEIK